MNDQVPVELHILSDSTGETAARLVLALEAQFPDLAFEEVRHPRVESIEDLALADARARGRPAVMVYTLVEPGLRDEMRRLCRRSRVHAAFSASFSKNDPSSIASSMRSRSCFTTAPAPRLRWPTSEFPI